MKINILGIHVCLNFKSFWEMSDLLCVEGVINSGCLGQANVARTMGSIYPLGYSHAEC